MSRLPAAPGPPGAPAGIPASAQASAQASPPSGAPSGTPAIPPGTPPSAPGLRVPFRARTRLVAWAKVLLPLGALALLSTLFLLARDPGEATAIPFAQIEAIARDPRIDAPRLAGVAPDGTAVTLAASRLLPLAGQPDGFAALEPRLETRSPSGLVARLAAPRAEVLGPTRTLRLLGGTDLDAQSPAAGPLLATLGDVTADLGSGTLTALGGVRAEGRLGSVRADALRLVQGGAEGTEGGARMVFNGAVRLVYRPPAPPASPAPPAPAGAPAAAPVTPAEAAP